MEFIKGALDREYLKFCQLRNNAITTGKMDLSSIDWFYPTTLLPLGIFIKEKHDIFIIPPTEPKVLNYYNIITKGGGANSPGRSYIPIVQIPPNEKQRENMLEPLYSVEKNHVSARNAFIYVISELADNVYQHSRFSTGYIMAQKYANFTEVGIIDNGISIPGSFENAGFEFSDVEALSEAINGLSTKLDMKEERGAGLRTSLRLLTEGLKGECLIISRGGKLIAKEEKTFYNMDNNYIFNGTFICARVPVPYSEVKIYDYIE